jgi:hypothetical protein
MKTNDPKKDHDKDAPSPQGPHGEALGADLVSRPEKNERGASAPGAELAPRAEPGPKTPAAKDDADRSASSDGGKRSRSGGDDVQPLAGTKGGESRPLDAGCVRCRVTGSGIKYHGRRFEEGTIADFDEKTVAEMPDILVPVDADEAKTDQE